MPDPERHLPLAGLIGHGSGFAALALLHQFGDPAGKLQPFSTVFSLGFLLRHIQPAALFLSLEAGHLLVRRRAPESTRTALRQVYGNTRLYGGRYGSRQGQKGGEDERDKAIWAHCWLL